MCRLAYLKNCCRLKSETDINSITANNLSISSIMGKEKERNLLMGFFENIINMLSASKIKAENEQLKQKIETLNLDTIIDAQNMLADLNLNISKSQTLLGTLESDITVKQEQINKLQKQINTNSNKVSKLRDYIKQLNYAIENYGRQERLTNIINLDFLKPMEDTLSPEVILKLHCMDVKELRKAYKNNEKQIDELMKKYTSWYTTKANKAIYSLMVIALKAELQNILYNMKYEKLDNSIDSVKSVTKKYLDIASVGNQSIVNNLKKFIGELEYLFINAVKIEYNYYVKKEQSKQEQQAIREQMRQEAAEKKALEAERKKIAKEEEKYENEINKVKEMLSSSHETSETEKLQARILELQTQLSDVIIKKEEVANLQNGKAGTVYVISNLGSFGENIFKIGMTRRLDPQDRINELSNASVPFRFDVHSFIFSEDAVALENKMHEILREKRVNKVNLRKEFFNINIDELEKIVEDIEPTAEFNKTILAEEFRQSLSTDENYISNFVINQTIDYDDESEQELLDTIE